MARISHVAKDDLPDEYKHLPFHKPEDPKELPEEYRHLLQQDERNVHRVLSQSPVVFEAFKNLNAVLWNEIELTPCEIEKCILTIAKHVNSEYEWHAHVRIALYEGLEPEAILAISKEEYHEFSEKGVVLLEYIKCVADGTVDDEIYNELLRHYDESTSVEITILAGFYAMMALGIDAFDVEVEEEFVGWNLENL